ncbi:hypothetical protein HK099_000869 [Clydaea vesicula]|uniref:Uncharacterized protein n=1 Tax=Clydaea vesicula TaxID=447962 RepID=A0AAD5TWV3_9FUNG|nr:hypothetical protein HK099_000869 [Clydaea vesicula]
MKKMTTFTQSLSRKVTAINPNATGYEINNLIYTQKTISKDLSATAIDMQKANTILATWGKHV